MTDPATFLPSMPVMVRDFMSSASVAAMTNEQLGAFMRLLFCAWMSSPPCTLPDDDHQLASMAQMPLRRWRAVGLAVKQRFPLLDDGHRRNEKQWTQWQYAQAAASANQARGRKAAAAKAAKNAARQRAQGDRDGSRDGARDGAGDGARDDHSELTIYNQVSNVRTEGVIRGNEDGATVPARPSAPLHDRSHRTHAHCGRVCLHASQFSKFVRRRHHDGADREIRDWCLAVERAWGPDGPRAHDEPGDPFAFWKARYAEQWPATAPVPPSAPSAAEREQRRNTAKYARPGP